MFGSEHKITIDPRFLILGRLGRREEAARDLSLNVAMRRV
jgi:hypothetical protein